MGLRIQERGEVVKGTPVVQPADDLFWFNRPGLLLYLIHFVLFQNAFQLAFFLWAWYEFGSKSCFHENTKDVIVRISMGVLIQILCSYVTLPLYALVTQMGSTMKPTIFNDRVAKALHNWRNTAKKNVKQNRNSGSATPLPSVPSTPGHGASPVHLLRYYQNKVDSVQTSPPRASDFNNILLEANGSASSSENKHDLAEEGTETQEPSSRGSTPQAPACQHEIQIQSPEFSFNKRSRY